MLIMCLSDALQHRILLVELEQGGIAKSMFNLWLSVDIMEARILIQCKSTNTFALSCVLSQIN